MVNAIIIPIVIVAIAGISGFLIYRFVLYDYFCKNLIMKHIEIITLKKHNFK